MFVDHHIQKTILATLMKDGQASFSNLKPDNVENSLFMYHMRKLINRGMVEKQQDGFGLTAQGTRWLNRTGSAVYQVQAVRSLVQLIVIQDDKVLVSERRAHLAKHMNRYLLPGGLHDFGYTSLQSAQFTC